MNITASSVSDVAPCSRRAARRSSPVAGSPSPVERQGARRAGQLSPACAARAVAFLRSRHPVKTSAAVAADTGLQAETIKKWLDRSSAPSFAAVFALIGAYGPAFIAAVMEHPPAWIDNAARAARREALARDISRLQTELARLGGDR